MYMTVYFGHGRSVLFELQMRSCSRDQIPYQILTPLLAFPRKAQQFLFCLQLEKKKNGSRRNTRSIISFK